MVRSACCGVTFRCSACSPRTARSASAPDGSDVTAKVSGGFLSVTKEGVSVLAERAELA